jgi:hypothetical protein
MACSNPELWQRLAKFEVSPPDGLFSFVKRLAREQGWSLPFAHRAFDEYRRFLYLSVVVGQPLAASGTVDRIWRLHLSYPAAYAQALCRDVLGQRLRYRPVDGADREAGYRATLEAYEQEFGTAPPAEIWPAPEGRSAATEEGIRRSRSADREAASLMPAARRA